MARVTTKLGKPNLITIRPFNRPRINPVKTEATQHQTIGTPLSNSFARTPALAASVDATDKSMSPLMMTKVRARARSPISI